MPFYLKLNVGNFITEKIHLGKISKGLNTDLERISFGKILKLNLTQFTELKSQIIPEKENYFVSVLDYLGEIYPSPKIPHHLESQKPYFVINTVSLKSYLENYKDIKYRVVFSFGRDNNKPVLFIEIKDSSKSFMTVENTKREINQANDSLINPLPDEEAKKDAYLESLRKEDGVMDLNRRNGISHVVSTQTIESKTEIGFLDFIMHERGDKTYIYYAKGKVNGFSSDYRIIYFSKIEKIEYMEDEMLYDRGSLCCPPMY
jgi:hypothetical protein